MDQVQQRSRAQIFTVSKLNRFALLSACGGAPCKDEVTTALPTL
jgi:hypothetical protein